MKRARIFKIARTVLFCSVALLMLGFMTQYLVSAPEKAEATLINTCESDEECDEGLVCDPVNNNCLESCTEDWCTWPDNPPVPCTTNEDCLNLGECVNGFCDIDIELPDYPCETSEDCTFPDQCIDGQCYTACSDWEDCAYWNGEECRGNGVCVDCGGCSGSFNPTELEHCHPLCEGMSCGECNHVECYDIPIEFCQCQSPGAQCWPGFECIGDDCFLITPLPPPPTGCPPDC